MKMNFLIKSRSTEVTLILNPKNLARAKKIRKQTKPNKLEQMNNKNVKFKNKLRTPKNHRLIQNQKTL